MNKHKFQLHVSMQGTLLYTKAYLSMLRYILNGPLPILYCSCCRATSHLLGPLFTLESSRILIQPSIEEHRSLPRPFTEQFAWLALVFNLEVVNSGMRLVPKFIRRFRCCHSHIVGQRRFMEWS